MQKIIVELGAYSYNIIIDKGLWLNIGAKIRRISSAEKVAIITDDTVDSLYGEYLAQQLRLENFTVTRIAIEHEVKYEIWAIG